MALAAQARGAQKADKPLEKGGALEQVAARIKRVMGLTNKVSGPQYAGRLDCTVRNRSKNKLLNLLLDTNPDSGTH